MDDTLQTENSATEAEVTPAPRRKRRAGLVLILSVAVIALGLPLLMMSLTGFAVSLPQWAAERIEERFNQRIGPETGRVSLSNLDLTVDGGMRPQVRVQNVGVFDARGTEVARLNEMSARLTLGALARGSVALSHLRVSGAQITIRRGRDGTLDLSLGAGQGTRGDFASVLDGIDRAFTRDPLASLEDVVADQLTITLEDARSGRRWSVTEGKIGLSQDDQSLDLTIAADVFNGTEELATAVIGLRAMKGTPAASLTATFENAAAVDIAAQSPALAFLEVFDAPFSGALHATIDEAGELGGFAGTLVAGAGALRPTRDTPPIGFDGGQAYVEYHPDEQRLEFSQLQAQSDAMTISATGQAFLRDFRAGWPDALVGQFALDGAALEPRGVFTDRMQFSKGAVDFKMRLDPFSIDVGQFALQDGDFRINGQGRVRTDKEGWHGAVDVSLNTLPIDRLLRLWPVAVAPGARDWLQRNVMQGEISDVVGAVRIDTGQPPDVAINYVYDKADVVAVATLPPIKNGAGYASLNRERYTMVIESGHVVAPNGGEIDVSDSVFHIPDIAVSETPAVVTLRTKSEISSALSLLNERPFEILEGSGLTIDVAEGRAQTEADIRFALLKNILFEDVDWSVTGTLTDVRSDRLVTDRVVTAELLNLRADPAGVAISGDGKLGAVPATVTWSQPFGPENGGRSQVEGSVELGQHFLDEFQIGLPDGTLSGAGIAQVLVDLVPGSPPQFSLSSDLNRIGLSLPALGWSKPRNRTGQFDVSGHLGDQAAIDRIALSANGLTLSGVVDLAPNGALERAQFDRVQVGRWLDGPVTLIGRGPGQSPAVAVDGGRIDMRQTTFSGSGGDGDGGPLSLNLDQLTVSEGITLTGFEGAFRAGAGLDGSFVARVNNLAPVRGTAVPTPSGAAFRLLSNDAGGVLAAAGILRNIRGGRMDLSLNPAGPEGIYNGRLGLKSVRVIQAPAMTELLNAISIVGLLDQLNGGGITLADVDAEFQLGPERLTLLRSSAVGPSLGISLDGIYDLRSDQLDMQGAISPVYFLNGIGQIFSRGRDGLFGFNFRLRGAAANPSVSVNPLSILTPGMFREIFRRPPPTARTSPSQ